MQQLLDCTVDEILFTAVVFMNFASLKSFRLSLCSGVSGVDSELALAVCTTLFPKATVNLPLAFLSSRPSASHAEDYRNGSRASSVSEAWVCREQFRVPMCFDGFGFGPSQQMFSTTPGLCSTSLNMQLSNFQTCSSKVEICISQSGKFCQLGVYSRGARMRLSEEGTLCSITILHQSF